MSHISTKRSQIWIGGVLAMAEDESETFSGDFYLSRYHRTDSPELVKHLSNKAISANLRLPPFPYTDASANEWYDFLDKEKVDHPTNASFRHTIRRRSTDLLVGDISLEELKEEKGTHKLGYWLAEEEWGKGIMTEAVRLILRRACEAGIGKIRVFMLQGNRGSRRVLEKNGFKYIGDFEEVWRGEMKAMSQFENKA